MRFWMVALLLFLVGCGYNGAVSGEAGIKAQWEQNMNLRDNMVKQMSEALNVAESERLSLAQATEAYFKAQNPEDGRAALMQWSQNAGVQMSPDLYRRVIDIMEARRQEFANGQSALRDRQRVYETQLNSLPNGPILKLLGFPHDLAGCSFDGSDPYCPPEDKDHDGRSTVLDYPAVVSGSTRAVFASGQDDFVLGE